MDNGQLTTQTAEHSWSFPNEVDRSGWGDGPWSGEPDKIQFVDPATDLDCLMVRSTVGAWCGYVGVPPGHPLHPDQGMVTPVTGEPDLECHGGITFSGFCHEGKEDGYGVCHVPAPGRPAKVFWFGFDCAHCGDAWPPRHGAPIRKVEEYRTVDYVRSEILKLAAQLAAVTSVVHVPRYPKAGRDVPVT